VQAPIDNIHNITLQAIHYNSEMLGLCLITRKHTISVILWPAFFHWDILVLSH